MSAAKMVADSTQGDVPEMSGTKKRKKVVQKKKVKKKKESAKKGKKRNQQEEEFDDSDLDLDKDIYPIGYFVKDRENLLEQMLHCVRGQSLNRALPDVLKELPLEDLKRRCMEQLEVMSKKRIRRILAGDDPASISSSGTEDETSEEEVQDVEDEDVEYMDTQIVDSTSYTLETAESDREVEYEEEGSVGHSSAYLSDEEPYNQQYEDDEVADGSDEDAHIENDRLSDMEPEELPGEPEEPEEGEVFDDNSDQGVVNDGDSEETKEGKESDNVVKSNENEDTGKEGTSECKETEEEKDSAEKTLVETNDDAKDGKGIVESEGIESVDNGENNDKNENDGKDNASDKNESDDKSNQLNVNVDGDERIVKAENTEEDRKQEVVKEVLEDTKGKEEHIITVESDHVIDEEAASIGAEHAEGEISDEGEVLEKEIAPEKADKPTAEVKSVKQPRRIVKPPGQDIAPALTRNQMELLELEMRARAIKAMLKNAK